MTTDDKEATAIARREGSGVPDEYERKYMKGEGVVLHRAKSPAPKWMQAAIGSIAVLGLALFATPAWGGALFVTLFGVLMWALFSVLRCTISEGLVNVQFGVFGPKIPIAAIESAEAIEYDWKKFGGWGIRRSLDGEWMYNMPGDGGRAIRIVWRDEKGKQRITNVGMKDAPSAAGAIAKAQRSLAAAEAPAELPPAATEEGDHNEVVSTDRNGEG